MSTNEGLVCRLCGHAGAVTLKRAMPDRLHPVGGATCSIARCAACGVVFTVLGGAAPFYPPDYEPFTPPQQRAAKVRPTRDRIRRVFYEGKGTVLERILLFLPYLVFRFRDKYKLRNKWAYDKAFRRRGRLLDVGCGRGQHLLQWSKSQDEVVGVEPHEPTATAAREETGLDIRPGTLESQGFPPESFHCIAFCHVLEHVKNPRETLLEARRVLKPGGEIILWVPNFDSLLQPLFGRDWFSYEVPRHLWHFNPMRLNSILGDCGLRPLEVAMDPNEYAFRRSVRFLRESGRRILAALLSRRSLRMLLGSVSSLVHRADVIRVRAGKA